MRQKRAKAYRKQMLVYNHTFKFRAPYQVLLDHEIVQVAQGAKIDLLKYLRNTLQAEEVKPMITQCAMQALYLTKDQTAIDFAKTFERRRCGHKGNAIAPRDCMRAMVDINGFNKHRYVVVTQDVELRRKLRAVPGVPLVYMNRSVMVMEPLSEASAKKQQKVENAKLSGGLNDKQAGLIKEGNDDKEDHEEDHEATKTKKRKGPKGPNPLSVKKPKKENEKSLGNDDEDGKKRKRRRKHKHASDDNEGGENGGNGDNGEASQEKDNTEKGKKQDNQDTNRKQVSEKQNPNDSTDDSN